MRPARKMKRVFLNDEKYTNQRPRRVLPRNTRSTPGLAAAAAAAAARGVAEGVEDVEARRANAVEGRAGKRARVDVEARRANAAEGGTGGRRLANRNPRIPPTPPLRAPPRRREENVEVEKADAEDAEEEEAKRPSTTTENGVGLPARRRSIGVGVRRVAVVERSAVQIQRGAQSTHPRCDSRDVKSGRPTHSTVHRNRAYRSATTLCHV